MPPPHYGKKMNSQRDRGGVDGAILLSLVVFLSTSVNKSDTSRRKGHVLSISSADQGTDVPDGLLFDPFICFCVIMAAQFSCRI